MSVQLVIPDELTRYVGGTDVVSVDGQTLTDLLSNLVAQHPDVKSRVLNRAGRLQPHLVLLHNGKVVQTSQTDHTTVSSDDRVELFTVASGG